jgi:hypothetical protein
LERLCGDWASCRCSENRSQRREREIERRIDQYTANPHHEPVLVAAE